MITVNQTFDSDVEELWKELKDYFGSKISWAKVIHIGIKHYARVMKKKKEQENDNN